MNHIEMNIISPLKKKKKFDFFFFLGTIRKDNILLILKSFSWGVRTCTCSLLYSAMRYSHSDWKPSPLPARPPFLVLYTCCWRSLSVQTAYRQVESNFSASAQAQNKGMWISQECCSHLEECPVKSTQPGWWWRFSLMSHLLTLRPLKSSIFTADCLLPLSLGIFISRTGTWDLLTLFAKCF